MVKTCTVTRWSLILMLGTILASASFFACGPQQCPNDPHDLEGLWIRIGPFQSWDAGMRAGVKRLAAEIQRCPLTQKYRVEWTNPSDASHPDWGSLVCAGHDPRRMGLGLENSPGDGIAVRMYIVDRAAIKVVAEKGGAVEDFDKYDQSTPEERKKWEKSNPHRID
ncbi:MAG TPA: hypothetical protein VJX67_01870 [Blastocatellia bacterium]|nr:hypothetical protein [Blastocatellia bacterium]